VFSHIDAPVLSFFPTKQSRVLFGGTRPGRMATKTSANAKSNAPENLKRTYEAALGELRGEEAPDRKAKTPIYRRKREGASTDASPAPPDGAVADAADALAALWKTSSSNGYVRPKDQRRTQK